MTQDNINHPFIVYVDDEEFEEIIHNLENPTGPSETILRGAELLRKLYPCGEKARE